MPKTPQINIRVPEEHHGLIKVIAARLRIEPGVATRLAAVLGDDSAAGGDASPDLAGTDAVLARLAAVEATADQIALVLERLESLETTVRTVEATVNLHDTYIRELRQDRSAPGTPLRSNGRHPVESGVDAPPPTAARRGKGGKPGAGRGRGKTASPTADDIARIRTLRGEGRSLREIAEATGFAYGTVQRAANSKTDA